MSIPYDTVSGFVMHPAIHSHITLYHMGIATDLMNIFWQKTISGVAPLLALG
jgi:hypothetical protein